MLVVIEPALRPHRGSHSGMSLNAWRALFLLGAIAGCDSGTSAPDALGIMEGEAIYKAECASCHGAQLQGQPEWRTRRADGKLPAPPHDANGHTWHHTTEQLVAIVKFGMVPPQAPEGYVSDMPAFGRNLTDRQIRNVLAYIESRWPPEIKALRAERLQKK
jgi:mono/diheme cytochrome c family protein